MRTLLAPPIPRSRSWLAAEPDAVTGSWYPNLRAHCTPTAPDQLWVADLTYLRIGADAAFLAVILDASSLYRPRQNGARCARAAYGGWLLVF